MTLKEEQAKLDEAKWNGSYDLGKDLCGSYEYCGVCKMTEEFPCARAKRRHKRQIVRLATATPAKKN